MAGNGCEEWRKYSASIHHPQPVRVGRFQGHRSARQDRALATSGPGGSRRPETARSGWVSRREPSRPGVPADVPPSYPMPGRGRTSVIALCVPPPGSHLLPRSVGPSVLQRMGGALRSRCASRWRHFASLMPCEMPSLPRRLPWSHPSASESTRDHARRALKLAPQASCAACYTGDSGRFRMLDRRRGSSKRCRNVVDSPPERPRSTLLSHGRGRGRGISREPKQVSCQSRLVQGVTGSVGEVQYRGPSGRSRSPPALLG